MQLLTREQIFSVSKLKTEEVQVPEWGGSVLVRELDSRERNVVEMRSIHGNLDNISAQVALMGAIKEDGQPLFEEKDIEGIGCMAGGAIARLSGAIMRLSGLIETAAKVDALEKNFEASPAGSSPSGSQDSSAATTST